MDKIVVGIPTLNNPDMLSECIDAIYKTHDMYKGLDIKVLVIDDNSSEENLEKNKEICASHGLDLLMNSERRGVPACWNLLTRHYQSDYTILINDDIIVRHNWIDVVLYTLKNNYGIGVVGLNAFEGENYNRPENNVPTYVEAKILLGGNLHPILSARGFAFGFRTRDFDQICGFDETYFCFFEEIDFNLSMMKYLNKRNCILSHPILHHKHGATTTKVLQKPTETFVKSKLLFEAKWEVKWDNIRKYITAEGIPLLTEPLNEWNSNYNIWG